MKKLGLFVMLLAAVGCLGTNAYALKPPSKGIITAVDTNAKTFKLKEDGTGTETTFSSKQMLKKQMIFIKVNNRVTVESYVLPGSSENIVESVGPAAPMPTPASTAPTATATKSALNKSRKYI
jgi:hypothetical protein